MFWNRKYEDLKLDFLKYILEYTTNVVVLTKARLADEMGMEEFSTRLTLELNKLLSKYN